MPIKIAEGEIRTPDFRGSPYQSSNSSLIQPDAYERGDLTADLPQPPI